METLMRNALVLVAAVGLASPVFADDPKPAGSARQEEVSHTDSGSFAYARLGYGGAFADPVRRAPAIGLGYRGELDNFAVDVSFLNFVVHADPYSSRNNTFVGSLLRLQLLRFLDEEADRSAYVGAGLSWGRANVGRESSPTTYNGSWHGSGLQGEFTAGYEMSRADNSPLRLFVQTDIGLPFFKAAAGTTTFGTNPTMFRPTTIEERYIPSAAVSFGIGWRQGRRR